MTHDGPGHERPAGSSEPRRHEPVDLYELLEISPRASQDVIQAAYRTLARSYHPDVNGTPEAEQRIRQLNAAYSVLGDPRSRARYDLECLRAHRFERLTHPNPASATLISSASRRTRALLERQPLPQPRAAGDRFPALNGAALFGLLVVAAVVGILLVFFSLAINAPADYNSVFDGPNVDLAHR